MGSFLTLLTQRRRRAPAAPFVTWYGPDGSRAELSAVTYATSVAKTAGMLVDELEVEPSDRIRLALPLHWQLPVWLAACDVAGLVVVWPETGTATAGSPGGSWEGVDLAVVAEPPEEVPPDATVIVSAATPFGLPTVAVPAPLVDHFRAAIAQPDEYAGPVAEGAWEVGGAGWDGNGIAARARALAEQAGIGRGGRLLVPPTCAPVTAALACWAVPLLADASVVLAAEGSDPEHIGAVEQVTATLPG